MRLLDERSDRALHRVTLYLTRSEAVELRDSLTDLLAQVSASHSHIPSSDYQKELTICIYDEGNLAGLSERSRKLILEDV